MLSRRTSLLAALAAAVALAVGAPAASASTVPTLNYKLLGGLAGLSRPGAGYPYPAVRSCGSSVGAEGQGPVGGVNMTVCGYGLTFVGPTTSINNVVGPTIISPGFAGSVIVAGGNVAVAP